MKKRFALIGLALVVLFWLSACAGGVPDASKSRADAQIQSGNIPPADELRIGEYLNYYKQNFPAPVNETLGLDLRLGNPQLPTTGGEVWLQVGLQARDGENEIVAPLNLAIVIDASGSMNAPEKMPLLQESLQVFLHSLAPNDQVALVAYSDTARVIVPMQAVGDGSWIRAAIEQLEPGGSTNLQAGLMLGFEQVAQNFDVRRNNRVILLTDGIANKGVTDPSQIAQAASSYNQRGIYLSTIGLGQEYNDALLVQLAQQGKGAYHFVGSAQDMDKIFRSEVTGLVQKAASDVSVTIQPQAGIQILQVTGYEGTPPRGNLTVKLKDMGTGDSQVMLMKLNVPPGPGGARTLAQVGLRYQDLFKQQGGSTTRAVVADASAMPNYDALWDVEVLRNVTIQHTAEGLKEIDRLYRARRYLDAWNLAYQLEQRLRAVARLTGEAQLSKDADTMQVYMDTLARWVQYETGHAPQGNGAQDDPLPVRGRLPTPTMAGIEIETK